MSFESQLKEVTAGMSLEEKREFLEDLAGRYESAAKEGVVILIGSIIIAVVGMGIVLVRFYS